MRLASTQIAYTLASCVYMSFAGFIQCGPGYQTVCMYMCTNKIKTKNKLTKKHPQNHKKQNRTKKTNKKNTGNEKM